MNTENPVTPQDEKVVVYETPDGEMRVDVRLDQETVWLTQRQMAEVFQTSSDNVGLHLKNVFADGELEESATTEDFSVVQTEGKRQVRRAKALQSGVQEFANWLPLTHVVYLLQDIWLEDAWNSLSGLILLGVLAVGTAVSTATFRWE